MFLRLISTSFRAKIHISTGTNFRKIERGESERKIWVDKRSIQRSAR